MSIQNNERSLRHYMGQVWLTKPDPGAEGEQGINVCVQARGEFIAVDYLQLAPNGVYSRKGKPLGRLEDASFKRYIEKLAGAGGMDEQALFAAVGARYAQTGDLADAARAFGLSPARARRILITQGLLTSPLIEQIAWLYDGGRGRSPAEIAAILKVSEATVTKNLPYGKTT